jgi:predicted nucleic acid-binding protein
MLPEEGRLYLQFLIQPQERLHDGEAAALAIAIHRNAQLVSDDRASQRKAASHGASWTDGATFLQTALPKQLGMFDPPTR